MKANIVQIKIDGASADDNKTTTERVAKLFLALSSGDMMRVVESLAEKDQNSAAFVMALSIWKHITLIFENLSKIEKKGYTKVIMPALLMLPLLIYQTINENQDKKKDEDIKELVNTLLQHIYSKECHILHGILKKLHQKTNKSHRFSWALWINNLEQFEGMVGKYFKDLNLPRPLKEELKYLLNFMTGKFLIDRFS
jgi:hypothetical protein